jgi:hypothetical protein
MMMMMVLFGRSWAPASGSILTLWGGRPKEGGVFRAEREKIKMIGLFFLISAAKKKLPN